MNALRTTRARIALAVVAVVAVWLWGLWHFRPWVAHNDFAVFRLRLERELDGNIGLVGAYSRLGVAHPGPLREWLFALPYWSSGRSAASLPATAVVLNLAWIGVGMWVVRRRRRTWSAIVGGAGLVALIVALRHQLDSAWNPHLAVLPLFVACLATAAVLTGERTMWVPAVAGASFAGQLHASALLVAGSLFVLVVVGEVRRRRPWWRPVALGSALWIGPIVDLVHGRDANLVRMLTVTDGGDRLGLERGAAGTARLLSPPTWWQATAIEPNVLVFPGWSRVALVVVVLLLGAGAVRSARRHNEQGGWAIDDMAALTVVALTGIVASTVSIAAFVEPAYRYLFGPLQAVGVFAALVALAAAISAVPVRSWTSFDTETIERWTFPVVGAAVGLALVSVLATTSADDHESAARRALAVEPAVAAYLDAHPEIDTVTLVDAGVRSANISAELAEQLVRDGLDPRSARRELELDPPLSDGVAFVTAMGAPRDCLLTASQATQLADGVVPSVDDAVSVFAVELGRPDIQRCLATDL